ncbi:zinc finger protein [Artemisia annua]|uniref:Zinc finger protein n=1 Tax=Artemisia annua TaxID=35608 RepID=A0A2U1KAQ4_ARTAN|nr:zinc finger protein [Artemisia annua]
MQIAGVPGVTEALFLTRQTTLAEEKNKLNAPPKLYTCGKGCRSSKAHAQYLNSRSHTTRVIQDGHLNENTTIVKTLAPHVFDDATDGSDEWEEVDGSDEWEEVDGSDEWEEIDVSDECEEDEENDNLVGDTNHMVMDGVESDEDMKEDEVDPICCFMCDKEIETIEGCMIHMHKRHGFFIHDVEYLKDPRGLLTYLGLKVKRDYMCLYCNINCQPFRSLEAVSKHMVAKGHCRVHYGDGDEEEEAELDEFYDYSSSYVDGNGKPLVTADGTGDSIELGSGGSELVITNATNDGISAKAIGSREYLRYYRQKPRPSSNGVAMTVVLAARNRNMGLSTVQSKENMVRMKVMKQMNRSGVDVMRSKIGMKSNVIRDLPKNVEY